MQVEDRRNDEHGKELSPEEIEELLNPESYVFPQLMRQGLGRTCDYCLIQNPGYSTNFVTLKQYLLHVIYRHEGYSIYAFEDDLQRFKRSLSLQVHDYQGKLKQRMKDNLIIPPARRREDRRKGSSVRARLWMMTATEENKKKE